MADIKLSLGSDSDPNHCPLEDQGVMQERLRHARLSFNLALVVTEGEFCL